jgi:branched-chain amino acid transport system ATP-binding protein
MEKPMSKNPGFLDIHHLNKSFGGLQAIKNVSFSIGKNEIVGLIGPNGAGKSTLIKLIIGLLKPNSGNIVFKGKKIHKRNTWDIVNLGISLTFQNMRPFKSLPVIANVKLSCLSPRARKKGEWFKKIDTRAMEVLEFVGISDQAFNKASALSQGELKLLEIARAVANEPELLFLDEPFGGLSPTETDLMAESIIQLHSGGQFNSMHKEGPAMIIIGHNLEQLVRIVNRIIVLNFGEIIADGTPELVMNDKLVIESYLGKGGD